VFGAVTAQEHWDGWKRSLGEGGLVCYRYVGCSSTALTRDTAEGGMRIRADLRTGGGLLVAPLGIALLDTAGINVDAIGQCAPTRIDVSVFGPAHDVEAVRIFGEIVREGRTQMFTQGRFEDAARPGRVIGFGTTSWAVMAPTPPGFVYVDPGPGVPDAPDLPPFVDAFGVVRRDDRAYELAGLSPSVGADSLHQGPIQAMLEAAALDVARDAAGTDAVYAEHTGTTIVQRGKIGPFAATATVLARADGSDVVACAAELRDEGADARLVATGFSIYRRA
jgi:acyl-coenzyme A thioesterase PaaI-like protein